MDRLLTTAAVVSHSGADAIYQTYEIICDETEFDELRNTAQRHCPDVAPKIDDAMTNAVPNQTAAKR